MYRPIFQQFKSIQLLKKSIMKLEWPFLESNNIMSIKKEVTPKKNRGLVFDNNLIKKHIKTTRHNNNNNKLYLCTLSKDETLYTRYTNLNNT